MRFSLQDVKRQIRRRDGELTLALHFLRPGELRVEIARLVEYFEQKLGQKRENFATDEASALAGDYRLANCLLPVLSAWYSWQQPTWTDVISKFSEQTRLALDSGDIHSSIALRLALFDYVNAHYAGFLLTQKRAAALAAFSALYALENSSQLEYLLALDTEDKTILVRTSDAPPDADAIAALYNQWVFEAALFNASEVRFVIDCEAFLAAQRAAGASTSATGIGAVIKRLCYLARKLGVYYDLAYEPTLPGTRTTLLQLTLYGPQEMTGSPQQYGQRLARLCRLLLRYGLASTERSSGKRSSSALAKAIRRAEATVYLFQTAYRFSMESELLGLLPAPGQQEEQARSTVHGAEASLIYDSSVEQTFAEAFAALERSNGVDGWQLEREPEPLLLSFETDHGQTQSIFIPDFAVTRGERRIYVEILGFWTPAYRERKTQKLQHLRGKADLILAFPLEARAAFSALGTDFPLIEYREKLSATDLLRVLQARYDDFEARRSKLNIANIRAAVQRAGFVPERNCYELLHCYRRSELLQAGEYVQESGIVYTPGLGLYSLDWVEHIHHSFVEWIEAKSQYKLSLSDIIQECQSCWPELAVCDENTIETLFGLWPEVQIQRDSIFEALLIVEAHKAQDRREPSRNESTESIATASGKNVRERRSGGKKRQHSATDQQNLWE
ncbi:MAG TPA: DUF790 family protein [Ktedonobacteraceae bacterium]|nr:DUF790 family protein [Ktedonobacteraceae bacterium]